ncbi:MAG: hypothetical protein AB7P18_22135 [Candidatus Binatia bacterium]
MRAKLRLELRTTNGQMVAEREGYNSVMRSGAELLARLFSGQGVAISHMGVGISDAPETDAFATTTLSNDTPGLQPLSGGTEVAIPPEAFQIDPPDETKRSVRVRVRATLPAIAAVGVVREAGLLSRDGEVTVLYNRVTFPPVTKADDHELTMFWEVSFPYGDLQWLG